MPDHLVVFPTAVCQRQHVRRAVLAAGFADGSGHTTMASLTQAARLAARLAGLLPGRDLPPVARAVLLRDIVTQARTDFLGQGALAEMSDAALVETLEGLLDLMTDLGGHAPAARAWLLAQTPARGKLRQLGRLLQCYQECCRRAGWADLAASNAAVLALFRADPEHWPALLHPAPASITFQSFRWLNPFEESLVTLLQDRLGRDRVRVGSALPAPQAAALENSLAARLRSDLISGIDPQWQTWTQDLADALAVADPALAIQSRERVSFSKSAGLYGEVEDLARRICWEITDNQVAPEEIALVVRNLGQYADAIQAVFRRFGVPVYFRRGTPCPASATVKLALALLSFPIRLERDRFVDLLLAPSLRWPGFASVGSRQWAGRDLVDAGVGRRLTAPELQSRLASYYARSNRPAGSQPTTAVLENFNWLEQQRAPRSLAGQARGALAALDRFALTPGQLGQFPGPTGRGLNRRALGALINVLQELQATDTGDDRQWSRNDFCELLEQILQNMTIPDGHPEEAGVWILNPYDMAGLKFAVVLVAGLNERVFPAVHHEDALLSDNERQALRAHLEASHQRVARWAVPPAALRAIQEEILFLSSIGAARGHLVVSYQATDAQGTELTPSGYYRKLWEIAGWTEPAITPGRYDAWRIEQAGHDSALAGQLAHQQALPIEARSPLPGESYLATVPLALCRAPDEARQRMTATGESSAAGPAGDAGADPAALIDVGLRIERARDAFFRAAPAARSAQAPYSGKIATPQGRELVGRWRSTHPEVSATALEQLACCRYRFLLGRICRLEELEAQDDRHSPMDRGTLIHRILECLYAALKGDRQPLDRYGRDLTPAFADLCQARAWMQQDNRGNWSLRDARPPARARRVIALVRFDPGLADRYFEFAQAVAAAVLDRAESGTETLRLGSPEIWATERPRLCQIIRNYVAVELASAPAEHRYPAWFELRFGSQFDGTTPDLEALALRDARAGDDLVRVHGRVDRIDVAFDPQTGKLCRMLVIDYKGSAKAGKGEAEYLAEIAANLDCQLPIYGFVAQQHLFGRHNTGALNDLTHVVYHTYHQSREKMEKQFAGRSRDSGRYAQRVQLSGQAADNQPATGLFLATLRTNLALLDQADFSVDPQDCAYCDFANICRVDLNALQAEAGDD